MWFRLKRDYQTREGEIHYDSWHTAIIKKGAPVLVRLELLGADIDIKTTGVPGYSFIFASGGLNHLILDDLVLPGKCSISNSVEIFAPPGRNFSISPGTTDI